MKRVLVTDCGSTTTKALLFEKGEEGWFMRTRGEAPTTVEKPLADVTIGAMNAFREVQELSGLKIISTSTETPFNFGEDGIDLYLSTSSAGGGLQMIVGGAVSTMTAESAERAALGAGAIVMDTLSADDGREQFEQVQKIRHMRPDIFLISGGTDGGTSSHPIELAETILQADPQPRFGHTLTLPVIYAGNNEAAPQVEKLLGEKFAVSVVENLRPTLDDEQLEEARDAIHEIFLKFVMSHAPGYQKLLSWSPKPIIPTPAGVGNMVEHAAKLWSKNILAVDIGGATTDVFSVFHGNFNRTVSANLGMSYSVANVLIEAGASNIKKWLSFDISEEEVQDRLRNKMIRPTTIPQTKEDLELEQAVCREALTLAFHHHLRLASGLKGVETNTTISKMFSRSDNGLDLFDLDLIIGSGGVLSHAPERLQTAMMLLDAYQPVGFTELAVDSVFMMPHLGVLATVDSGAAAEIFKRDCIISLGTAIAPKGQVRVGKPAASVKLNGKEIEVTGGELKVIKLEKDSDVSVIPLQKNLNFGNGKGKPFNQIATCGMYGIFIDCRERCRPTYLH